MLEEEERVVLGVEVLPEEEERVVLDVVELPEERVSLVLLLTVPLLFSVEALLVRSLLVTFVSEDVVAPRLVVTAGVFVERVTVERASVTPSRVIRSREVLVVVFSLRDVLRVVLVVPLRSVPPEREPAIPLLLRDGDGSDREERSPA